MATNLRQLLTSLCSNTDWNYAIFWRLQHGPPMTLTWEDSYYDNPDVCNSIDHERCQKTMGQFHSGYCPHDPLGLAVSKMSYHVYSLGEGIVGQVALTGKHQWIFADDHATSLSSSFEFADGWQSQFSAGIRTILVVAIAPHGVVQLGSLNRVIKDMRVVTHIRNIFLARQNYSIGHVPNHIQCSVKNSLPDVPTTKLSSEIGPDCLHDTEGTTRSEKLDISMSFPCSEKNHPAPSVYQKIAVDATNYAGPVFCSDESSVLLKSVSNMKNVEHQKFSDMRPLNENFDGGSCGSKDNRVESERNVTSLLHNLVMDNNLGDSVGLSEKAETDFTCLPSDFHDDVCEGGKLSYLHISQKEELTLPRSYRSSSNTSLKFPAGCELHEALGPAFVKSGHFDSEGQVNKNVTMMEMPDEINRNQLTHESGPEHLLEAIVANACHSSYDIKSELSYSTSAQSVLMSTNPEGSMQTASAINSEGYSIESSLVREDTFHSLTSSSCPSSCCERFERTSEPGKNKKRTRPGESGRPRPRDRQLIQDRIKELRELVPNGSKCSIDSLLERTIKHMVFLQSIAKHADKLNKFTGSKTKLRHLESAVPESFCYELGSSWAMEVGGNLKVHSILVENLSKSGHMLVEMLCEECSHFLEIAEAIRSLGLTILKGATEAHSEKTWICFVVEGQNNRNVHRLDILWPLVQILQSKSAMHA